MQQQLLPNLPGMGMMPGMFPYMPMMPGMAPGMGPGNMTPQQQQAMWQQQMQNMQNMVSSQWRLLAPPLVPLECQRLTQRP